MLFVRKRKTFFRFLNLLFSLYKEDVLYQGDTRDLPEYRSHTDIPTYIQETTKVPDVIQKSRMKAFWDVFISMTNFNLLNDKKMIIRFLLFIELLMQ